MNQPNTQIIWTLIGVVIGLFVVGLILYFIFFSSNHEDKKIEKILNNFKNRKLEKYKEIFNQHKIYFDEYSFKTKTATYTILKFKSHNLALFSFHGFGKFEDQNYKLISQCYTRHISWFDLNILRYKDHDLLKVLLKEIKANACLNHKDPPKGWEVLGEILIWTEIDAMRIIEILKRPPEDSTKKSPDFEEMSFFNLSEGFSEGELKTAYRRELKRSHPDHGGSREALEKVQTSFNRLNKNFKS